MSIATRGLLFDKENRTLEEKEVSLPDLQAGEALVNIKAAALNRRDDWILQGRYPNLQTCILGSDGSGIVEAVEGEAADNWQGKEVIINPSFDWGDDPSAQSMADYHILGMPTHGTFADYLKVPVRQLQPKPAHLTFSQAAALPLGGLTAYRAVSYQAQTSKTDRVLVTGAGGGVAQFAVQFAVALGANVYVTSGEDHKLETAQELGAKGGVNYQNEGWPDRLQEQAGLFDIIVDSACGDQMNHLLDLIRPGGTHVFYGATLGMPSNLHVFKIFWKQIHLQGSTMGNEQDFTGMVNLVNKKKIVPAVDSELPLEKYEKAFEKIRSGEHFGKIVLTLD